MKKVYRVIQHLKHLQKYNKEREKTTMKKVLKATAAMLLGTTVLTSSIGMTPAAQAKPVEVVAEYAVNEQNFASNIVVKQQSKVVIKASSTKNRKSSVKQVYKAYNEFMEKKKYESRMSKQEIEQSKQYKIGYVVLDIDQNGIPELLVSVWDENNLTNQGNIYLYTYTGKKVKSIGKMGFSDKKSHWTNISYNTKTKKIWLCDAHEGDAYFICYTYNGKTIKKNKKYFIKYNEEDRINIMNKVQKLEKSAGKFIKLYINSQKSRQKHLTFQLNKTNLTITQSKKAKLKITGKISGLKWSSTNPKVATVKNGIVTAKKKGKALIKARLNGSTVCCNVTVKAMTKKQKAIKAYNKFMESKKI